MGLFEMKKMAFENAVRECSERLGLTRPPVVSITEVPCPWSSRDEIAHIHPYEYVICIWKKKLESLNLDAIREVAAHEVAHLRSLAHDGTHAETQAELEIGTWQPQPGVVVVKGDEEHSMTVTPPKITRFPKNVCSYHSCKIKNGLNRCIYCGKKFCGNHLKPKLPRLHNFGTGDLRGYFETEDWRGPGHPCPPFPKVLEEKRKLETERCKLALDRLSTEREDLRKPCYVPPERTESEEVSVVKTPDKSVQNITMKKAIVALILAFIALLLIYLIFFIMA